MALEKTLRPPKAHGNAHCCSQIKAVPVVLTVVEETLSWMGEQVWGWEINNRKALNRTAD